MEKNSSNFSMEEAKRLASTDAGRQLLALLQGSHAQEASRAAASAESGDMEQAKRALSAFLKDPQAQALLRKLQEERHG